MIDTKLVTPMIDLVLSCQWFVAVRAAGGEVVFVACRVAWFAFMRVKTTVCHWFLADCTAKMLWMPNGVKGGEIATANRPITGFTN